MFFLATAANMGSLMRIECPHCHDVQMRGRVGPTTRLSCRNCGKSFMTSQGYGRQMAPYRRRPKRRR